MIAFHLNVLFYIFDTRDPWMIVLTPPEKFTVIAPRFSLVQRSFTGNIQR